MSSQTLITTEFENDGEPPRWVVGRHTVKYSSSGTFIEGFWDGKNFHVSGYAPNHTINKDVVDAKRRVEEEAGTPDRSMDVTYREGLSTEGIRDGNNFVVTRSNVETRPKESAEGSSKRKINKTSDNNEMDDVNVFEEETGVSSMSYKNGVDSSHHIMTSTPLTESKELNRLQTSAANKRKHLQPLIYKKSFYGDNDCNVFPKQYGNNKSEMTHDINNVKLKKQEKSFKDVVRISSSDEDETSKDDNVHKNNHLSSSALVFIITCVRACVHGIVDTLVCRPRLDNDARKIKSTPDCADARSTETVHGLLDVKYKSKQRDVKIKITKLVYRTQTFVPIDCHLSKMHLVILFRKEQSTISLKELNPEKCSSDKDRLVFEVSSSTARKLDKIFNCNTANVTTSCRLTIVIDPSTPDDTLTTWFDMTFPSSKRTSDTNKPSITTFPLLKQTSDVRKPSNTTFSSSKRTSDMHKPSTTMSRSTPRERMSIKEIFQKKFIPTWKKRRPFGQMKPFFYRYGGRRSNTFPRNLTSSSYLDETNDEMKDTTESNGSSNTSFSEAPVQVSGFSGDIIKLFTYPSDPTARGITITNEDLFCLNEGEYLNDVIIDFYLKYLFNEFLSPDDRSRTHVFSSFFYGHLVSESGKSFTDCSDLTIEERRHLKVQRWTRHVDLFSKDFIIVPINENYHWFLAIICFPALVEPYNKNVMNDTKKVSSDEISENSTAVVNKRPCILIFDSLQGEQRWDISRILREYLQVEWKKKKKEESESDGSRIFDKDQMKGCRPPCPQQPNYSDCGLYLLQYVEAFFKKPLTDFRLPIRYLKKWFNGSEARAKRLQIRTLILDLKTTLNPKLEYDQRQRR